MTYIGECIKCDKGLYEGNVAHGFAHTDVFWCKDCHDQPERSKREDDPICICERLGTPNGHKISWHRCGALNTGESQ